MSPVEGSGGGHDVEVRVLRETLADSRRTAACGPLGAEIERPERGRAPGGKADDGVGERDAGGVLQLDRSIGEERRLG